MTTFNSNSLVILMYLAVLGGLGGCGPGVRTPTRTASGVELPERVDAEHYPEALRTFHGLAADDPARDELRGLILDHLAERTPEIAASHDYEEMVRHFASMTELYAPEDYDRTRLGRQLAAPARFIVEYGSPRGDEARVLSAYLILRGLFPDGEEGYGRSYRELVQWGRDARATVPGAVERYTRFIDVWEEHCSLTPERHALSFLARLHVERRDAVVRGMGNADRQQLLMNAPVLIRRAPLDVAAVFLRHGDVASAVTQVEAMGDASGTEGQLGRLLRDIRAGGEEGSDGLLYLAEAYRDARADVALGLCRYGHRQSPRDPRFPICLARIAASGERYADATAWYAEAVRLAPGERVVYDEALEKLNELIETGLFTDDPSAARAVARQAEQILDARMHRFRGAPPVPPERFHYVLGMLEMNTGNAREAKRRFEASIAARENADALLQLGLLLERVGESGEAARRYMRALELTPQTEEDGGLARAEIQERLGDAFRTDGNPAQAERMYRQALALWDGMRERATGRALAALEVRRGVLLERLGQDQASAETFRAAITAAPDQREAYAQILAHLVIASPNAALATDVFRRAQNQLTLEPQWKVYFALWVKMISERAGAPLEQDVEAILGEMSSARSWWGRLARFGSGRLPYGELLDEASSVGERAEAHFYEGARLLASGDQQGAERLFRRVLESRMVNFYEYGMAQALLFHGAHGPAEQAAHPDQAAPAP